MPAKPERAAMSVLSDRLSAMFGREVAGTARAFRADRGRFRAGVAAISDRREFRFDRVSVARARLAHARDAAADHVRRNSISPIIFTANLCGLTLALDPATCTAGRRRALSLSSLGVVAALAVGGASGAAMGATIADLGAHPILVSLAMMIFLRGLGEYLTRGGDISGLPDSMRDSGTERPRHSCADDSLPQPRPCVWHVLLARTRLGFSVAMIGSNPRATRYSGIAGQALAHAVYALSGVMCALAGIVMLTRFNSVRVGEGEALLLITVLACFLGGVDPFGGFGRVAPVAMALLILQRCRQA